MYQAHFGLKEPPFKITPNTEAFYAGANRGAVLDALMYAITSGEGIIKVVGEVGSGKTMLCRMLQAQLPAQVESIYLAIPSVAPEHVLQAIAFELQLKLPKNADKLQVLQVLQNHLLNRHAAGKQVVIFVEEAQAMPLATLEEIRLLSNLETKHDKLLQIVLFGQPELDVNLNETHIRQLRERITHSFYLGPLKRDEIGDYLIFRLRAAGYFGPHLFTEKAIKLLADSSLGLVRRVNILGDKSLLSAFAQNQYQITEKHVKAAIADSEFGAERNRNIRKKRWFWGLLALGVACLLGAYLLGAYLIGQQADFWHFKTVKSGSTAPLATTKPVAELKKMQIELQDQTSITPLPDFVPATETSLENVAAMQPVVSSLPETSAHVAETVAGDILSQRITSTEAWLTQQPPETVSIQLLGSSDATQLKIQLEKLAQEVAIDNVYVYRTKVNGLPFLTVLYGGYADRQQAIAALKGLPANVQKYRPHLRTIAGVLQEIN